MRPRLKGGPCLVVRPKETVVRFRRFGCQYVLRLDPGEEVRHTLWAFADHEGIRAASFLAMGMFSRVQLRCFDVGAKQDRVREIDRPVEVVSLVGSIGPDEGDASIHMHAIVSDAQATSHNGHLDAGTVGPALEVFLTSLAGELQRRHDSNTSQGLLALTGA